MNPHQHASDPQQSRFGELLCESGAISYEQLNQALLLQKQRGGRIGEVLFSLGYLSTSSLVEALQKKHQVRALDLTHLEIPSRALKLLPLETMELHNAVPLEVSDQSVYLAMADPGNLDAITELEFRLGRNIEPIAAPSEQIRIILRTLRGNYALADQALNVRELCDGQRPGSSTQDFPPHQELCRQLIAEGASDLLLSVGAPPSLKKHGVLLRLPYPALSAKRMVLYARGLMSQSQWEEFQRLKELDFSCSFPEVGRFRVNMYLQRGTIACTIRATIEVIPTMAELGLPLWLAEYALRPSGLILIAASTGQGKTTTLAALVDLINSSKRANIITIEEPIEYQHRHKLSNVNQREVGVDTESFQEGLKRVFRQAPDVIVIGEIRDPESAAIAIQAASTGHLVISTVHASSATTAIERLIDIFAPNHQHQIRSQLAESLLLVLGQRLVPVKDGQGRVLACEKLINSPRVRSLVREGKTHLIRSLLQQGTDDFQPLDATLAQLCREGRISQEEGLKQCDSQSFFQEAMARAAHRS
jgi:twitching motility protein PilT